MKTRNIIFLIVVLVVIAAGVWGFLISRRPVPGESPSSGATFVSTFWPFGNTNKNAPSETSAPLQESAPGLQETNQGEQAPAVNLRKVSSMPIAGYGVFMKERYGASGAQKAPYARYADKSTGNIYQTFADKIEERKFSASEVPGLYETVFGGNGENVIMRYLKNDDRTIETYDGSVPKEILGSDTSAANNQLTGTFLPENISALSLSPDFSKIFYIAPSGEGVAGITADISGRGKSQVFYSPFSEWISQWPNSRMISLTTKASGQAPGYMYSVDPTNKSFIKILGSIAGLTTLTSPSGRKVLYADGNMSLRVYDRNTGQSVAMGVNTLPEKCVWGSGSDVIYCAAPKSPPSALYPDAWYQGTVSFSDSIWKLDPSSGNSSFLADPSGVNGIGNIDAVELKIDPSGNYLFFMDKTSSYLYELVL